MFAPLQCPTGVHRVLGLYVCRLRQFSGWVQAKITSLAIETNEGDVSPAFMQRNAEHACFTVFAGRTLILVVAARRHITQIRESVVVAYPVSMVYLCCWPRAGYVKPCQSMRMVANTTHTQFAVPVGFFITRLLARQNPSLSTQPREHTRLGVVVQQFTQAFCRQWDNLFAHTACPPDKGVGSDPRGLAALAVASLYAGSA